MEINGRFSLWGPRGKGAGTCAFIILDKNFGYKTYKAYSMAAA